jgi:hypothetical protein
VPPKSAIPAKKKEKKKADSPTESIDDLAIELEKCKLAMKGPYLDREENRKLR